MAWTKVADQLEANTQTRSVCIYGGDIWAGMGTGGASGGKLYHFTGSAFEKKAEGYDANSYYITGVQPYGGSIAGLDYNLNRLLSFDTDHWDILCAQYGSMRISPQLILFGGVAYTVGYYPTTLSYLLKDNGAGNWSNKGNTLAGVTLYCLKEHVATIWTAGSNGKLYQWNGIDTLTLKASYGSDVIYDLCSYDDGLYGGVGIGSGKLLLFDNVSAWDVAAVQYESELIRCLISASDGNMYAGTDRHGYLLRFNGSGWDLACDQYDVSTTTIFCLAENDGCIYAGTDEGTLLRFSISKLMINRSAAWKGSTAKLDINANWKVTGIKVAKGGNKLIGDAHDLIGDMTDTIAEYGGRHWKDII
jgi:hypothetical protein